MNKVIKFPAHKRTIFIKSKKYFLELPSFVLNVSYKKRVGTRYDIRKPTNQYTIELFVQGKKKLRLPNIDHEYSKGRVCLNKSYYKIEENFHEKVVERFFFSKFGRLFQNEKLNDYFYSQWEKYGVKYHNYFSKKKLYYSMSFSEFKRREARFFKVPS